MSNISAPATTGLLSRISEHDRDRLGEALRRLVANGSIVGTEPGQNDIYHWSHQNRDWLDEIVGLLDLRLFWEHESRIVQAVPQSATFLLRLKLDATLVLLTLWYEFDTAVRDRAETPPVALTVQQLNDSLRTKFEPLQRHLPSASRLREILTLAQRKNLLRFTAAIPFEQSGIEILSTLKRVIPFQDLDDWTRHVERHLAAVATSPAEDPASESEEATS
jgi:hypothetical protein